ncbi:hypothetical protein UA08_05319 [Talaromyces atroroseus]|uniref:Uncharacterized protein n=1 Tax=Talaromyces atroroseus TaxID=1441469 RepID=A0A225AE18_TALAT|nr:hypothetical protein UA08_05319 [Talaromyces atroroseus]OKL59461.1 hypothetical protein UA08_05319 [Talaromyces atroroseus]
MIAGSWATLVGLSVLLARSGSASAGAEWTFFDNECYGTPSGEETFQMNFLGTSPQYTFPGGHFVEVGDACGPGNCFAITYNDECNACLVKYGSGCYNIDLGWEPTSFMACYVFALIWDHRLRKGLRLPELAQVACSVEPIIKNVMKNAPSADFVPNMNETVNMAPCSNGEVGHFTGHPLVTIFWILSLKSKQNLREVKVKLSSAWEILHLRNIQTGSKDIDNSNPFKECAYST